MPTKMNHNYDVNQINIIAQKRLAMGCRAELQQRPPSGFRVRAP